MSKDPYDKLSINTYGYYRSCTNCGWNIWWDVIPSIEDEVTILLLHDVNSPSCSIWDEVDDDWR